MLGNAQDKTPTILEAQKFFDEADVMLGENEIYFENEPFYFSLAKRNVGDIIITGSDMYQVIGAENAMVQNCGLLYFDTQKLSVTEIATLRKNIITKYNRGISFGNLVTEYKNDKITGIESNDVIISQQAIEFQKALENHVRGDIFTVDVPNTNNCCIVVINANAKKTRLIAVRHLIYK
jgi:hypothetical protein